MAVSESQKGECPEKADARELNFNFVFCWPVQRGVCKRCIKKQKQKRDSYLLRLPKSFVMRSHALKSTATGNDVVPLIALHCKESKPLQSTTHSLLVVNAGELSCNCGAAT